MSSPFPLRPILCCGFCLCLSGWAGADVIRLHDGGEIRGQLLEESADDAVPLRMETVFGSIVSVAREEVEFVRRRSLLVEEYVTRSRRIPSTVEAHWELAEWCRVKLLPEQRTEQLELLLEIDPDHAVARRILGHIRHNGQWMPREELMALRGYVRHKGKWITQQELELIEQQSADRKAEVAWYPRIRLWVGWVTGSHEGRRAEGYRQFEQLTDPDAIPAMTINMAEGDVELRRLYVRVLSGMKGAQPALPLLERYLLDEDESIYQAALAGLKPAWHPPVIPRLIASLNSDSNQVVRRAAAALGRFGDETAIPALIKALVTTHTYKVQVATSNAISFGTGSSGMVDPRLFSGARLPLELEVMARTGQLPYGAIYRPSPVTAPKRTSTITVRTEIKNEDVLNALVSLTGKNFGYNERDWQLWWSIEKG